ncbi:MAG TPA: amino acid adenylation domain-containing protein [Pyrinomonadaceae bacterium]|nr:amino acid adenylation domain-containing protein [Pyrinomonadaceae bacterium]
MIDLNVVASDPLADLIEETNAPHADRPGRCAHQLFEVQAERTPEAIAVVCNDQQLTYRELNERANQLAHKLVRMGVGADSLIGIFVERSPAMVVGLLACLKSGAAYVPLDPSYPAERLAFMLEDARVAVLLTESKLTGNIPQYRGPRICLDTDWQSIETEVAENPAIEVNPESLAYVIYTSGSTGKPKGAMIRHRGLANYLSWCVRAYCVADGCGAPVHSSISFDLTVTSLFAPLMAGRSVFLLPDGLEALAAALLERENYSLVKITPAHLRALAELIPAEEIRGRVNALIIGGEALHFEGLSFWRQNAPATRLINEYGPTETVVGCCVYEVAESDPLNGPVPIGVPIANTSLRVLADNLQPVLPGEPGELFIGGEGVGAGYLNREDLTRARFIADPFDAGNPLYRSGDLVRARPDGQLEYLGRADDQVKIRGFRIELGEIESAIKQLATVSDCAVVVCEEPSAEKRLAAYFVSKDDIGQQEIPDLLKITLPEYMIPSAFVRVDALPLTINGKVDRKALAALAPQRSASPDFVPARTAVEETLANIWAEVLNLNTVSIHDNFFDLGGDSILGTLILARAARAGMKLSPMQLFEHQTIAGLASVAVQS